MGPAIRLAREATAPAPAATTSGDPRLKIGSDLGEQESPLRPGRSARRPPSLRGFHSRWRDPLIILVRKARYFPGGGTGSSPSATFVHLSPSSINITGMSSTMGYFRPQSLQINHASLCSL